MHSLCNSIFTWNLVPYDFPAGGGPLARFPPRITEDGSSSYSTTNKRRLIAFVGMQIRPTRMDETLHERTTLIGIATVWVGCKRNTAMGFLASFCQVHWGYLSCCGIDCLTVWHSKVGTTQADKCKHAHSTDAPTRFWPTMGVSF